MWDSPDRLDRISLALFSLSVVLLIYATLHWLAHRPLLPIRHVEVVGTLAHVTERQVEDVVRRELAGNFITLDLKAARDAFARLPWARDATVIRRWPDRLEVRIEERVAIALWNDGGLVDSDGNVFQGATDAELPVFTGPEGSSRLVSAHFAKLNSELSANGLKASALRLSARHALGLDIVDGPHIELGAEEPIERFERFLKVYPQHVAPLMPQVTHIDLRYRNGFALRSRDGKPLKPPATPNPAA